MTNENILLQNIYWSFTLGKYDLQQEFVDALNEYNELLGTKDNLPDLNEVFLETPSVVAQYFILDDEGDPIEPQVQIDSDNGQNFRRKEFLHKLNNELHEKLLDEDFIFFEGIKHATDDDPDFPGIPVYFVLLGK